MTNTQNVTELQPHMTREQLIDAARTAAKYLPVASAQLMTELANRLDYTSVALCEAMSQRKSLAAENGQMLRLLTDISENHNEYVNQDEYLYAGVPMDYVSEINAYVSRDVEAENPFKETDAFLAEVRASGVDALVERRLTAARLAKEAGHEITARDLEGEAIRARVFAMELRKGVQS
ncbi:hypothetical protein AB3N47_14455 [Enterobacter cloacae]|uniref:hypothetical protein n=1 Tax=Enterobacter cloacae TaxID=550 RepID=UPI00349EFA3A